MSIVIKNACLLETESKDRVSGVDVLIRDGKIEEIGSGLEGDKIVDIEGAVLVPGLCDLWSHFNEPGLEYKEDIASGLEAAKAGGFTDVCCLPNTEPIVDNKSQLNFIKRCSQGSAIALHPFACASKEGKDEVISEMRDLFENGAIAFTGGTVSISNSELLLKALQYTQSFGGLVINRPQDKELSRYGQMHEGIVSTTLGMKGIPSTSEKIAIERDLSVLKYAGGRLHLTGISSKEGVEAIRYAKKQGLKVTCDVPIHHLIYTDQDILSFDSNYKLDPPLRTQADQEALIAGLLDDTIDCIASYHIPQDSESKELEFDLADVGMISLQTVIPQLLKLRKQVSIEKLISKFSNAPREVLGLPKVEISVGSTARFTVIDTTREWTFDSSSNLSKSKNSVLLGATLVGKATGMFIGDDFISL